MAYLHCRWRRNT